MYFRLGRTRKYVEKSNEEPDCESLNDHMENCSLKPDSSLQKTLKGAVMGLRDGKDAAQEGIIGIWEKIVKHFGKKIDTKEPKNIRLKPLMEPDEVFLCCSIVQSQIIDNLNFFVLFCF